ncbi:MAG: ATP-binding protein [Myxococcales bacterium]
MSTAEVILDALPDAVFALGQDLVVSRANRPAEALLGVEPGSLAGEKLSRWLAEGEAERILRLEAQRRDGWQVPAALRLRFLRADGGEVPCEVAVSRTAGGLVLLSARDASERTRAEALMSQLASVAAKAAALPDVDTLLQLASPVFGALGWVVTYTEVRGELARVRNVVGAVAGNAVAEYGLSLLGQDAPLERYPVVTAVVRSRAPVFLDDLPEHGTGPAHSAVQLSETMKRARGLSRTAWMPVPVEDGGVHVLAVAGNGLTGHDHVAIGLFAAQLAAARRVSRLRAQLVRRERLAAVGEMSAVLAHEVRNPLGVIFNATTGLKRLSELSARPEGAALLAILDEEAIRLRQLVDELLDFARPVAPEPGEVPLVPLVEQAIAAAQKDPGCAGPQCSLRTELPEGLPAAWADPVALRRALVNVLVNALQNVPAGGEVRVQVAAEGRELVVRVGNDGPRIPAQVAARVFEPFFTTRASGTGLGLAVVKQIVEGMDGRVELDQTDGVTFVLALPMARPPA